MMPSTLGFQLYTLKEFEEGWEAALDAVKAMGVDTIEAWCGAVPDDANASLSLDGLRGSLIDRGMKLTCGHLTVQEFDASYEAWRDLLLEMGSTDWVIPFARFC
jgi:sugar phosphate isomerase/epimerase